MTIELPDWMRGQVLFAKTATGDLIPILVDVDGNMNILLRGADAGGTVRTVRVDNAGQLYAILRGANSVDVAVDASGFLSAILKGAEAGGTLHNVLVDASGQIIMVPRGSSGNYLDVDANGYLSAILKGIHDSTLTTIHVDANGRIDAFLMDGSDQWGQTLRIGNAELAARLNPLHAYDWRGNVLWSTDFSHGIPSGPEVTTGDGASITVSPEYWLTGGYSMKLVGGSTLSNGAAKWFRLPTSPATRLGLEVSFSITPDCAWFGIHLGLDVGANRYGFAIGIDLSTDDIEYKDSAGSYVKYSDVVFVCNANNFHKLKMVVNIETCKYERFLFQGVEYDIDNLAGQSVAAAGYDYIDLIVDLVGREGYNDTAYVDSVVVTNNEPANS